MKPLHQLPTTELLDLRQNGKSKDIQEFACFELHSRREQEIQAGCYMEDVITARRRNDREFNHRNLFIH